MIIQHGNILFKSSEKRLSDLFQSKKSESISVENGLGIFEILGMELEFDAVAVELKKAFEEVLDIHFDSYSMLDEDIENAHRLVQEKYNNLSWTKAS